MVIFYGMLKKRRSDQAMKFTELIIFMPLLIAGVMLASLLPSLFEYRYDMYVIDDYLEHAKETIEAGTFTEEEQMKYQQEHPDYQMHSSVLVPGKRKNE